MVTRQTYGYPFSYETAQDIDRLSPCLIGGSWMKTICYLIEETMEMTDDALVIAHLAQIQKCAERMEDRLLEYCNAIEDLGFVREGRNYDDQ